MRWWGSMRIDGDAALPAGDQHHRRPAEADQQPVRAGHVRDRVVGVLGLLGRRDREVQVDGVLGQHAHEGEHEEREVLRDVPLRQLHRPREHEGRAEDREPGERRFHLRREAEAAEVVGGDPRHREEARQQEPAEVPPAQARAFRRLRLLHQRGAPNSRSKRARRLGEIDLQRLGAGVGDLEGAEQAADARRVLEGQAARRCRGAGPRGRRRRRRSGRRPLRRRRRGSPCTSRPRRSSEPRSPWVTITAPTRPATASPSRPLRSRVSDHS